MIKNSKKKLDLITTEKNLEDILKILMLVMFMITDLVKQLPSMITIFLHL